MDKFNSQQDALRTALTQVLGTPPKKGGLVITEEQRMKVGDLMMEWLKLDRWSIKPGTRAHSNPLNYIVGKQPTCLIEAWVTPKKKEGLAMLPGQNTPTSKMEMIKAAVDLGIISKEEGAKQFMALLTSSPS
jgi:hypothetical protein